MKLASTSMLRRSVRNLARACPEFPVKFNRGLRCFVASAPQPSRTLSRRGPSGNIELPDGFIWQKGQCGQGTFGQRKRLSGSRKIQLDSYNFDWRTIVRWTSHPHSFDSCNLADSFICLSHRTVGPTRSLPIGAEAWARCTARATPSSTGSRRQGAARRFAGTGTLAVLSAKRKFWLREYPKIAEIYGSRNPADPSAVMELSQGRRSKTVPLDELSDWRRRSRTPRGGSRKKGSRIAT